MPITRRQFAAASLALAFVPLARGQNTVPTRETPPPTVPGERRPDVMGRVTALSPDGKSLTISLPPRPVEGQPPPRDAKPETAVVNLTDKTQLLFFGVGEGEAKPAQGMMAMAWLEEGSKDRATKIRFMRNEGEVRPDVMGRVLSVSPDGKTVTVETRDERGDRPTGKTDLRIAPYTHVLFFGVGPDEAKPTADYQIVAWLEKGSKDTAARVRFMKNDR
jgi:hypothetical protein